MTFLPVQAQPFTLSGSGAVMGATSIILTSFTQIDGTLLTMADFGSKGFMTMEPGNSTLEEQISFTGVTQNANGTATLSGIKTVLMVSPYTETSGLAQTHAGSITVVLSNTVGFYNQFVAKDDAATITAVHTFTAPNYPEIDNAGTLPTLQAQFATKQYVDNVVIVGAADATTAVKGIVQLPTQAQVDAGTATGSTAASLAMTPNFNRSRLLSDYAADSGTANAYIIAPSPAVTTLVAGTRVSFKVGNTNTTTSTVVVNALSGTAIFKNDGATALVAGDLVAGQVVELEHNGINGFMLMTPPVKGLVPAQAGNGGKFLTTDATTASWGYPYDYQSFTGNGTWTKPSNLVGTEMVHVQLWGGGAGGGTGQTGTGVPAGGGGGGAFAEMRVPASALTSTVAVTIAAAVAGNTAGNPSTFGAYLSAYGGGKPGVSGVSNYGGGGGGGGLRSVGSDGSTNTGGAGGSPAGGAAGVAGAIGGGGGGTDTGGGGASGFGGGGGSTATGGGSTFGGGGGGGGGTPTGGAGGTALVYGGSGGAGGNATVGSDGGAPGGGGGGGYGNGVAGGGGARGECRVWVIK